MDLTRRSGEANICQRAYIFHPSFSKARGSSKVIVVVFFEDRLSVVDFETHSFGVVEVVDLDCTAFS